MSLKLNISVNLVRNVMTKCRRQLLSDTKILKRNVVICRPAFQNDTECPKHNIPCRCRYAVFAKKDDGRNSKMCKYLLD